MWRIAELTSADREVFEKCSARRVSVLICRWEGIQQLSRTLGKSSGQQGPRSVRSDGTLAPDELSLLEKTFRSAFDRYVL